MKKEVLFGTFAFSAGMMNAQFQQKPNIIFILIDDMGWKDLGCYGSSFYETPNIDRLASEGIRFTQAYAACPVSSPTRASILTGKYPVKTDVTDWIPGRQSYAPRESYRPLMAQPFAQQLALNEITIAEELKNAGYKTLSVGKWHLGTEPFYPQYQGFDKNIGGTEAGHPGEKGGYFYPFAAPGFNEKPGDFLVNSVNNEALKFIEENHSHPFFIYMAHFAVHRPIMAPDSAVKRFTQKARKVGYKNVLDEKADWIEAFPADQRKYYDERLAQNDSAYAALIAILDHTVGDLMEKLKELNLDKNTIIVFTSDNGGVSTEKRAPTCNKPLRAGKGWIYEGGIRVPSFIYYPPMIKKGRISDEVICSVDYFPTILELAGVKQTAKDIDGISLLPVFKGEKLKDRPIFWHYPHYSNQGAGMFSAVRLGDFKLIEFYDDIHFELYNLKDDISEKHDLSKTMPEKATELKKILNDWKKKVNAKMPLSNPDYKK